MKMVDFEPLAGSARFTFAAVDFKSLFPLLSPRS